MGGWGAWGGGCGAGWCQGVGGILHLQQTLADVLPFADLSCLLICLPFIFLLVLLLPFLSLWSDGDGI